MKKIICCIVSVVIAFCMVGASIYVSAYGGVNDDSSSQIGLLGKDYGNTSENNYLNYIKLEEYENENLSEIQMNLPTEELVDVILRSQIISNLSGRYISSTNNYMDNYKMIAKEYNGFGELEKRDDAARVMLLKLEKIVEIGEWKESFVDGENLLILLSLDTFNAQLSDIEIMQYRDFCDYYERLMFSENEPNDLVLSAVNTSYCFDIGNVHYYRSSSDTTTTSGTIVPLYYSVVDFSDTNKEIYAQTTANQYGITKLAGATTKYNCHSYAWYNNSTANTSWIVDVWNYINDSHSSISTTPSIGAMVVYFDSSNVPVHSAIVSSVQNGNVTCKSKWGQDGLFEHDITNVPLSYRYNADSIMVVYINYTRFHTCNVTIDNQVTHTRICRVCGWTATENHVENHTTGRCMVCGCQGPFAICYTINGKKINSNENALYEIKIK